MRTKKEAPVIATAARQRNTTNQKTLLLFSQFWVNSILERITCFYQSSGWERNTVSVEDGEITEARRFLLCKNICFVSERFVIYI